MEACFIVRRKELYPPTPAPERGRRTGRVLRMRLLSSSPSSAPLLMGHGYDEDPYLFHIRFKSPVRANWRCRGCVVIIIITTVGDAEVHDDGYHR